MFPISDILAGPLDVIPTKSHFLMCQSMNGSQKKTKPIPINP